jgi:transposase
VTDKYITFVKNMIRYKVTLTKQEREELLLITKGGVHNSKKVIHALILLNCDVGKFSQKVSNEEIARVLKIGDRTIDRIKKKFVEQGLEAALSNSSDTTRVYEKKTDGEVEAHLIALSCSEPPKGFSRWSLRLLADKMVEMQYIENISHETVRNMLKKTS